MCPTVPLPTSVEPYVERRFGGTYGVEIRRARLAGREDNPFGLGLNLKVLKGPAFEDGESSIGETIDGTLSFTAPDSFDDESKENHVKMVNYFFSLAGVDVENETFETEDLEGVRMSLAIRNYDDKNGQLRHSINRVVGPYIE